MAYAIDGLAQQQITNHSVSVRAHDEQIHGVVSQVGHQFFGSVGAMQEHRARR